MTRKNIIPKRVGNLPKHKMPKKMTPPNMVATPPVNPENNFAIKPLIENAPVNPPANPENNFAIKPLIENTPVNPPANPENNFATKPPVANSPASATNMAHPSGAPPSVQSPEEQTTITQIKKFIADKNNEQAIHLLQDGITKYPHNSWFPYRLSVLYYDLGKVKDSLALLEKVCEKEPNNPDYAMALGTFHFDNPNRDLIKAKKYVKHALTLKPFHQQAWRNYGVILYKSGNTEEGFEALYRSLQLNPSDFVTTNALCMYLTEKGRHNEGRTFGALGLMEKHKNALSEFEKAKLPSDLKKLKPKPNKTPNMKNIFSFSLWGADGTYCNGMIENTKIMPQFFPDWGVRVYHDTSVPNDVIQNIQAAGGETILVTGKLAELNPTMWRFAVTNDPSVYYFCCRDADCRPFVREQAAVEQWVNSGKSFHIMRDHIWHNELMMAGMWGGIAGMLPDMIKLIGGMFQKSSSRWHDQVLLKNHIWPLIYQDSIQHDSFYHLFGAQNYPIPHVEGDDMHVGYGHKEKNNKTQIPTSKTFSITKQASEDFDTMLERLWQENLTRDPTLQEMEVNDQLGRRVLLKRISGTEKYQKVDPSFDNLSAKI
ncbi:MAG: tetratricopeptide repeat protein [Alphaproteobacteria bacterium]